MIDVTCPIGCGCDACCDAANARFEKDLAESPAPDVACFDCMDTGLTGWNFPCTSCNALKNRMHGEQTGTARTHKEDTMICTNCLEEMNDNAVSVDPEICQACMNHFNESQVDSTAESAALSQQRASNWDFYRNLTHVG